MAPGQANRPAKRTPSSLTLPKWPFSISQPTAARQWPCDGNALNWHGQPTTQLQVVSHGPLIIQSIFAIGPSEQRSRRITADSHYETLFQGGSQEGIRSVSSC